jgi:hypothetical protein
MSLGGSHRLRGLAGQLFVAVFSVNDVNILSSILARKSYRVRRIHGGLIGCIVGVSRRLQSLEGWHLKN